MQSSERSLVPLVGALLVAEGLLSQEQINAAILLQQQDHPSERLGEILVRCGYISRKDLERILAQQQELRSSLMDMLDTYTPQKIDLNALILSSKSEQALAAFLAARGAAVDVLPTLPAIDSLAAYNLLIVTAHCCNLLAPGLPTTLTVGLLPQVSADNDLPPSTMALVTRYLEHARAYTELQKSMEQQRRSEFELRTISTLIRSVTLAQNPQDALLKLMTIVRDLIAVEAGTLFRLDPADQRLVFEVVLGPFQNELSQRRLSLDRGIAGWVARHGESLLIPNVHHDSRFEATFDRQTGFQTRSMLCVPLIALGQVRGVLQLINKIDGEFTEGDLSLLRITAAVGGMLLLFESLASVSSPGWLGDIF